MGYRWRNDPLTGEPILMNDAEVRDDNNAAAFSFMIIIMLVFSQLMLQDGTSLIIRIPLGIFSVIVGAILASNMFGVVMGIEALRKQRAERRGEVYKPPVEAVGFKALSKHENQAPKKRRKKKEPFIGNSE